MLLFLTTVSHKSIVFLNSTWANRYFTSIFKLSEYFNIKENINWCMYNINAEIFDIALKHFIYMLKMQLLLCLVLIFAISITLMTELVKADADRDIIVCCFIVHWILNKQISINMKILRNVRIQNSRFLNRRNNLVHRK